MRSHLPDDSNHAAVGEIVFLGHMRGCPTARIRSLGPSLGTDGQYTTAPVRTS